MSHEGIECPFCCKPYTRKAWLDKHIQKEHESPDSIIEVEKDKKQPAHLYADFTSVEKYANNQTIIQFAIKYLKKITGVILLDSYLLGSTNAFLETKLVSKKDIHVPQLNKTEYDLIAKQKKCRSRHCSMEAYLSDLSDKDFDSLNVCYFDYMGSIEGCSSSDSFPLEDMQIVLRSSNQKRIVLATTFSCRSGPKGKFEDRKTVAEQNEKDFLFPLFQHTQWKVIEQTQPKVYKREKRSAPMIFSVYVLEKDTKISAKKANFIVDTKGRFTGYRAE